jgi:hypothetical protein
VKLLEIPLRRFECPSCNRQVAKRVAGVVTEMHPCPKFAGLTTPMVEVRGAELRKNSVVHRVVERGDWVGKEQGVPLVNGQAVMAVRTERSDGYDTNVYAPVAVAKVLS